jgi:hypothetical protein
MTHLKHRIMRTHIKILTLSLLTGTVLTSCFKEQKFNPPAEALFPRSATAQNYFVRNTPTSSFKLPIGVTNVSNSPRTVSVSIASNSTAVEGTHFNITNKTITIPAGKAVDTVDIRGLYANLPNTGSLTLNLAVAGTNDISAAGFLSTQRVNIFRYCDVVLNNFVRAYNNTRDIEANFGPYTTSIVSATPLTTTTASIVVRNFYDFGFNDLTFTLNWTNDANFTVTLQPQFTGRDASVLFGDDFLGRELWIYPASGQTGSFSSCTNSFTIVYQFGVPGVGVAAAQSTVLAP